MQGSECFEETDRGILKRGQERPPVKVAYPNVDGNEGPELVQPRWRRTIDPKVRGKLWGPERAGCVWGTKRRPASCNI